MNSDYIEVGCYGEIKAKKGANPRNLFPHQEKAMKCLDIMNEFASYSTLLVLPTGGGKTYTASTWLLKNAINHKKKVLWIAHRHFLLDQAAKSFQEYAYAETIPHISFFRFRIISGAENHDRAVHIEPTDDLLIVGKDSISRNLQELDKWLAGEQEIFLIVDEAHHSTAKTYRKIIDYIKDKVQNVKLIGLTATPFRTAEKEQGLLAKIYSDGIQDGKAVHGDIGIAYQISLKELINRQILARPNTESFNTDEEYGVDLGLKALNSIRYMDTLPDEIAEKIAMSTARNKLIVDTYLKKQKEYGQTIIFALNRVHAIQLAEQFNKTKKVKADYIISGTMDMGNGATISHEENERKLEEYRQKQLQILISVGILTEGVDLPQTKTVFLARPTVSTVLMTQMVGRALRGEKAGGTAEAYIVSFVDKWNKYIAWVNPQSLFEGNNEFLDTPMDRAKHDLQIIAISKIEEFARIMDNAVDSSALERVPFKQRIPIGMYAFSYLEKGIEENEGQDISYQVMVYDSTTEAYQELMVALPDLFQIYQATDEYLSEELLQKMERQCADSFFCGEMIPPYEDRDIISILKYYAQYEEVPPFYTFDEIDKNKLDVALIARHIWEEDMGPKKKSEYLDSIWDSSDDNMLRLFFGRKLYFLQQVDIELMKIGQPDIYDKEENVIRGTRSIENCTLDEIRKINPDREKELRDGAYERAKNAEGKYQCARCGRTSYSKIFTVDHIVSMNKGGKSIPENLEILCRSCNAKKGDR